MSRAHLCRGLCRNPAIPARPTPSLLVSLGNRRETANTQKTQVNTAFPYHLSSLSIVRLHIGQRIDTVEVRSSSLLVPTISFNSLRVTLKSLASRPHKFPHDSRRLRLQE